jgi:hypothetical protein
MDSAFDNAIVNKALTHLAGNKKKPKYAWECKICNQQIQSRLESKCAHLGRHKGDSRLPEDVKKFLILKGNQPNDVVKLESGRNDHPCIVNTSTAPSRALSRERNHSDEQNSRAIEAVQPQESPQSPVTVRMADV